jgi:drug/metabolite transporter (DMT)-like permease
MAAADVGRNDGKHGSAPDAAAYSVESDVLLRARYPIGALAVSAMSPMAVLVLRFGLAGAILSGWALIARVTWPTGRTLAHVLVSGLLTQALQFICLYLALMHGAPAVLGAVVISMNPVVTALLAATFLGEGLTWTRVPALVLGVLAVLAACAGRLFTMGGVDRVVLLVLVALVSLAAGGVYQQRFCSGVDFRATAALQNAVALLPVAALAMVMPFEVTDPWKAAGAVAAVFLLNATLCMTLYVRAINIYGAAGSGDAVRGHPCGRGPVPHASGGCPQANARRSRQQRQDDPGRDGRGQHRVDSVHESPVTG